MFPTDLTATLTGATPGQLQYWRSGGVLAPEGGTQPRALYSFRDLVALRSFARIRSKVSLQKIRTALDALQQMDLTDHPSRYELVTDGRTVLLVRGDQITDLVHRKYHAMIALDDVFKPFRNAAGHKVVSFTNPRRHLEVREARVGGWPTIRGTRVRFDIVADLMVDVEAKDVHRYFPGVSAAAARDAWDFQQSMQQVSAA